MRKYVVEEYVFNGYNASSKAREDVSKIVLETGFKSFARNDKRGNKNTKYNKIITAISIYAKMLFRLRSNDIIFLQTSESVLKGILKIKKIKHFKIIYLIHDMFSVRYDEIELHSDEISKDINMLNQCEYIICHNKKMKEKLIKMGCICELYSLSLFDYLLEKDELPADRDNSKVTLSFAGNLSKSQFLDTLDAKSSMSYEIYGKPPKHFAHMNYMGSVDADQLPYVMKGNYGLIWEGEYQIQEKDNYIRFNNPHKASLYIASGMPIIIWKGSALSDYVESEKIGISINNLDELDRAVEAINEERYNEMVKNCLKIRAKVIKGIFLKNVLKEICKNDK